MRLLAVGDLHGNDCWEKIETALYDRIIFLGDYVDDYSRPDQQIVSNLKNLIQLKSRYPDKIVLLLGNHDIHYLYYPRFRCSGFNALLQPLLSSIFRQHRIYWQVAYQCDQILFSHAGLSNAYFYWLNEQLPMHLQLKYNLAADQLNRIAAEGKYKLLFTAGPARGGSDPHGGPLWADLSETMTNPLDGYRQIVGHTPTPNILTHQINAQTSITYINVLEQEEIFYELIL